jgi:glycerol-3-phosphate dehydrogenase
MPRSAPASPPAADRGALLERLRRETFDLAVVGGGITGASIARDAAMRGLSVALVEKGDIASGTSSRSSRLIHGGLRYLRHRHIRLVREGLRERGLLLRLAPHLVRPIPFTLPVYEDGRDSPTLLRVGLTGYDLLAGTLGIDRHRALPRDRLLEAEPALRERGLQTGFRYFDAITNDARLTLAVALSAVDHGAAAANYVEAVSLETANGRVSGVNCRDLAGGPEITVRARAVVGAAGPWTDQLRAMVDAPPALRPTKGIHVVVPRERLHTNSVVAFYWAERPLFAAPAGRHTYVGTTDTDWTGDPSGVEAHADEVAHVLDAINGNFNVALTTSDVSATWAGVRPLITEEGSPSPSDVSRDYEIFDGPPGVYIICGGKLTSARAMAADLLDHVVEREASRLSRRPARCRTTRTPLPGATADFDRYRVEAAAAVSRGWGLTEESALHLVDTYGTDHVRVLGRAAREPELLEPVVDGSPILRAEVAYAASAEMAVTLEDFMRRRSDLMLFGPDCGPDAAEAVAAVLESALTWDRQEKRRQLSAYGEAVARMTAFRAGRGAAAG